MEEGNVIQVQDVYKKFKNYFDKSNNLKEKVLHKDRNKYQEYWVLKGMQFNVAKGEAVGLVGRNGCGKSTTLKLLTKIIYPDKGKIEIQGRVSSLLELGAGFHPDLSGYENIYLNAAVFGLTRKEIDKRVDEIIRFSELREFINNPIRTYSSGMYMKLAFSVAINVDADILLIDEILGVGDVNFQKKCFEKLQDIKKQGTTIVIVSHSTDQIERICDRSIWIEDGRVKYEGEPKDVHARYLEQMGERRLVQQKQEEEERRRAEEEREAQGKGGHGKDDRRRAAERKNRVIETSGKETERFRQVNERRTLEKGKLLAEAEEEKARRQELLKQMEEERQNQENAEKEAAERRKRLEELQQEVIQKKKGDDKAAYYLSEKTRLEVVVQEKNMEIERLNSVIREKNADVGRVESLLKEKENQLNQIVLDKDTEIARLEGVIRLKDTENETLQESLEGLKEELKEALKGESL